MQIKVKRLRDDVQLPEYQTEHAAGFDLTADREVALHPGAMSVFNTGIAIEIPPGYEGECRPRSGLAFKHGVTLINSPGTVDADYRGEVKVKLINHGKAVLHISKGARIAQMLIKPVIKATLVEVQELSDTARGSGGFGHTG